MVEYKKVEVAKELPAGTQNIGDVDIASALPTGTNTIGNVNIYAFDGTNWQTLTVQSASAKNLRVTIFSDSEYVNVGSVYPGTFVTTYNPLFTIAGLYAYDGTNFRRLFCDVSSNLYVNLQTAIPAGTNYIGKVRLTDGTDDANIHPNGAIYTFITDATNTVVVAPGSLDGTTATNTGLLTNARIYGFNGTTWDRLRTDADKLLIVKIGDGTETATVTAEGYLDVKTHTPEKCFAADYAGAQSAQVIITPTTDKKIRIVQVYASTETNTTDITLQFTTSGNIFFKLYTNLVGAATGNIVCGEGDTNETVSLTCGAGTFVSIAYDEIT